MHSTIRRFRQPSWLCALLLVLAASACAPALRPPETFARQTFTAAGRVNLNYEKTGIGETTLLFLHGFGASLHSWDEVRPGLPAGATAYFLDLKGFGASDRPRDFAYAPEIQAGLVAEFVRAKDLRDLVLVGQSYGGGVALLAALELTEAGEGDRIAGLALIDSAGYPVELPSFLRALRRPLLNRLTMALVPPRAQVRHILKLVFHDRAKISPGLVDRYAWPLSRPGSVHSYVQTAKQVLPAEHEELVKRFAGVAAPTLVLWGAEDRILPLEHAHRFDREIPDSRLVVLPACGHAPQEECPEQTAAAIREFVEGLRR